MTKKEAINKVNDLRRTGYDLKSSSKCCGDETIMRIGYSLMDPKRKRRYHQLLIILFLEGKMSFEEIKKVDLKELYSSFTDIRSTDIHLLPSPRLRILREYLAGVNLGNTPKKLYRETSAAERTATVYGRFIEDYLNTTSVAELLPFLVCDNPWGISIREAIVAFSNKYSDATPIVQEILARQKQAMQARQPDPMPEEVAALKTACPVSQPNRLFSSVPVSLSEVDRKKKQLWCQITIPQSPPFLLLDYYLHYADIPVDCFKSDIKRYGNETRARYGKFVNEYRHCQKNCLR